MKVGDNYITKKTAIKNSVWKLFESFGSKGISMLVSVILARLIMPESYGVVALTAVFMNLSDLLIQAGFSTTLIRKETVSDEDYATVFCISIISSIILYLAIFISSPWIARIYQIPQLCSVLRVISLVLFCQAFAAVRTAEITRSMRFKTLFVCTIIANILSGIIGIAMALFRFEVWSLVVQQLSQQMLVTIFLFFTVKTKYKFFITKNSIKEIVVPSFKILLSSLLSFAGDSLYSVSIGKVYSMEELAYTEKGSLFPRSFSLYIFSAVSAVFLPVFASYQNDFEQLNKVFRRILNLICFIIFPMMAGLGLIAKPLISLILTDTWLPITGIMRWNCLYYAVTPIMLANIQLHFAIGKNETRIKTEIIRIIMLIVALVYVLKRHVSVTDISAIIACLQSIIVIFIMWETKEATGYNLLNTIKDLIPIFVSTGCMSVSVYYILKLPLPNMILIIVSVIVGTVVYGVCSLLLKSSACREVFGIFQTLKNR